MFKKLEEYLQEIEHYLVIKEGTRDVLSEIKSHILEKTEYEFGEINEETLEKTIKKYGKPIEVAEKYMEGYQIISPGFKKHLFLYTWIFFLFHLGLTLCAWIFNTSMLVFPFFYIPLLHDIQGLFYLPMAWVYDFGLVGIFLYAVTQKKWDIRLPWPGILKKIKASAGTKVEKPSLIYLVVMALVFGGLLFLFLKFQTVFYISANLKNPESVLNPGASVFFSICLLAAVALEIFFTLIRFFNNSDVVMLVKNSCILLVLWAVWNYPGKIDFKEIPGLDLKTMAVTLVGIITLFVSLAFIRSLIRVRYRKQLIKRSE